MNVGNFVQQPQGFKAFIPSAFPSKKIISFSPEILIANDRASRTLGKLDGMAQIIPNIDYFLSTYIQKEAAVSSNIEGTKATMHDAFRANIGSEEGVPDDVENILSYIKAVKYGLQRLQESPLTLRVVRELHEKLMANTREGIGKTPGEFRTTQNWIGGTRPDNANFVPPPPKSLGGALAEAEKFLNTNQPYPPLIKAALFHAQFETIHPFLDGNGRTGRLLITLQLHQDKVLEYPTLYLSDYFKRHRDTYFDRLSGYHNKGEVDRWILFFLEGITTMAEEAIEVSKKLVALRNSDMEKVHSLGAKQAPTAVVLLRGLYEHPYVDIAKVEEITGLSRPAANALVKKFVDIGILHQPDTKTTYARTFAYLEYILLFEENDFRRAYKEAKERGDEEFTFNSTPYFSEDKDTRVI